MRNFIKMVLFFIVLGAFSTAGFSAEKDSYKADSIVNGNLKDAESGLLAILEKNPNDQYALLNLAYVYKKAGDKVKAQDTYNKILALKSNPYADLASGKSEPVKNIARRGIVKLEVE